MTASEHTPGYWMHELGGLLRPAVEAYLSHDSQMTEEHFALIRAYLIQWMAAPWRGVGVAELRNDIDQLTSREALNDWLNRALDEGIDPL